MKYAVHFMGHAKTQNPKHASGQILRLLIFELLDLSRIRIPDLFKWVLLE